MRLPDAAAILLSVLAGLAGIVWSVSSPPATAVRIVTPSGEYRYRLDRNNVLTVPGALGGVKVEIDRGRVRVTESACPDRICVHRGWISRGQDSVICVPNRVIVRLENSPGEIDAVTE